MRISKNIEVIIIVFIYLTCLFIWTLPLHNDSKPFGEVDAASHYALADYMFENDHSIGKLPFYIDWRYGKDNSYQDGVLWYPPPYHVALAGAAIFGGSSDAPVYFTNAIFCSLIILGVYFVTRKLFGLEVAIGSAFLLIFSLRDIMIYIWGQWPERMAFAYIPLILYCFYKYHESYKLNKEKKVYLYFMSIFLAINLFIHPMVFFHTIGTLIVFGVLLIIKNKKIPFNWKSVIIPGVIFLLLISLFPLQVMNVLFKAGGGNADVEGKGDFSRLIHWFKPLKGNNGVPPTYYSYKDMVGPSWTVIFIIVGIGFLLLRRREKDLLLLSWLIGLYLIIHLDFFGMGRVHRSLSGSAHIFYILLFVGLIALLSFVPIEKTKKKIVNLSVVIIIIYIIFSSFGLNSYKILENSYQGYQRINEHQYEFTKWLKNSDVSKDAQMSHVGSISLAKTRWMWMSGQRFIANANFEKFNISYVILDYSDFAMAGDMGTAAQIQALEGGFVNNTLIYSNNYMKVYQVEN